MEVSHENDILARPAAERLRQFVRKRCQEWEAGEENLDFEIFERELHEHMMVLERELIAEELTRYDVDVEEIDVEGTIYSQALTSTETYLSSAGSVTVARHLYRPAGRSSKSICPLELRAGIIRGLFTPRAARQATFVMAHLTPREAVTLFEELGGMTPSRSTLDRLPKELSLHWEEKREMWEEALRTPEVVPSEAVVLAVSLDGVMVPMKNAGRTEKRSQPDKQASGPAGFREVGCGTIVLYNADGERLSTVRYGRKPEYKKATLCGQLEAECQSILGLRPDLKVVKLADGAKENWRFLDQLDLGLPPHLSAEVQVISIVDFCHAADHLKKACDAIWTDNSVRSKAEFERYRTLLKEEDGGVEIVIRSIRYHFGRARGHRREQIEKQLIYFRNQRHRMQYAQYLLQGLPIASGVVEAACKTLATQRLKQSGMSWGQDGCQAILTLRSLIQSNRWERAWALLRADFCKPVHIVQSKEVPFQPHCQGAMIPILIRNCLIDVSHFTSSPLAA